MATWVNHLRIAEGLINELPELDSPFFAIGNMAPDGGKPNNDHSAFFPEKKITHWENEAGKIEADRFFAKYLKEITYGNEFLFYIGYYCHLLTDIEWGKIFDRKVELYRAEFATREELVYEFKREWYGLDCDYLNEHKDFIYFTHFINQKSFKNVFLDYFDEDAFEKQIKYVKAFYMVLMKKKAETADKYLTIKENEEFVDHMIKMLKERIDCIKVTKHDK